MEILDAIDETRISELLERDEFFWLDLHSPDRTEINRLEKLLDLDRLAVEDTLEFGQRPKLDEYGDKVLLVYYGVHHGTTGDPSEGKPIEVHLHISGSWIVSVRPGSCRDLTNLRDRLKEKGSEAEGYIVYRILDALTDSFMPLLSAMDDEIDSLEDAILAGARQEQLHRLFELKRELTELRRIVTPQRDLLASGGDLITQIPGLSVDRNHNYFRDVYDHTIRISDLIDSYRDLLSGTLDIYLSVQSNRMNEVMKQLTVIATIFLPLTFVTGFFGQNFGWLVGHITSLWVFLVYGGSGIVLPVLVMVWYFRRRGFSEV